MRDVRGFELKLKKKKVKSRTIGLQTHFNPSVSVVTMQPPVVNMTDCSFFLRSFKQSKATVRLKEDMKKIVAVPLNEQRSSTYKKLFGVSLQDLQQQGLTENGIPAIVGNLVEYLTKHGKSSFNCCFYSSGLQGECSCVNYFIMYD